MSCSASVGVRIGVYVHLSPESRAFLLSLWFLFLIFYFSAFFVRKHLYPALGGALGPPPSAAAPKLVEYKCSVVIPVRCTQGPMKRWLVIVLGETWGKPQGKSGSHWIPASIGMKSSGSDCHTCFWGSEVGCQSLGSLEGPLEVFQWWV